MHAMRASINGIVRMPSHRRQPVRAMGNNPLNDWRSAVWHNARCFVYIAEALKFRA